VNCKTYRSWEASEEAFGKRPRKRTEASKEVYGSAQEASLEAYRAPLEARFEAWSFQKTKKRPNLLRSTDPTKLPVHTHSDRASGLRSGGGGASCNNAFSIT
jgi:hypothetical protein